MASLCINPKGVDPFTVGEPSLDDLLAEPIVQLFMERDRQDEACLRRQIDQLRHKQANKDKSLLDA